MDENGTVEPLMLEDLRADTGLKQASAAAGGQAAADAVGLDQE